MVLEPSVDRPIEGLFFKVDSANFSINSPDTLISLIGYMLSFRDMKVTLTGHCDSLGTEEYNMKLSFARAETVKAFLSELGAKHENITVDGKGESEPIADNGTQEGRDKNRRVEYRLSRNPDLMKVLVKRDVLVQDFEGLNDLEDTLTLPFRTYLTGYNGFVYFLWKNDTLKIGNESVVSFYVEDGKLNVVLQKGYLSFISPEGDIALCYNGKSNPLTLRGSIFKDETSITFSNFEGKATVGELSISKGMACDFSELHSENLPEFHGLDSPRDGAKIKYKDIKSSFGVTFDFGNYDGIKLYHLTVREGGSEDGKVLIDILAPGEKIYLPLVPGKYLWTASIIDTGGNESVPVSGVFTIEM